MKKKQTQLRLAKPVPQITLGVVGLAAGVTAASSLLFGATWLQVPTAHLTATGQELTPEQLAASKRNAGVVSVLTAGAAGLVSFACVRGVVALGR